MGGGGANTAAMVMVDGVYVLWLVVVGGCSERNARVIRVGMMGDKIPMIR